MGNEQQLINIKINMSGVTELGAIKLLLRISCRILSGNYSSDKFQHIPGKVGGAIYTAKKN